MATAIDFITDALGKLGVYAPGEPITAADMATGFNALNDLFDNWSNQSLAAYANTDTGFPLVGGKSSYTIGSGGDVNVTRPLAINSSQGSAYVVDSLSNVYPVDVIDQTAWDQISSRNVSGTWPEVIFYDPQYPLGILNVWPSPLSGYTLHFTFRTFFVDAAQQTSTIALPPGYSIALKYNLALELIPYFPEQSQSVAPLIVKQAAKTLADLKRTNTVIPMAGFDVGLGGAAPAYDIYTDR